MTDNRAWRDGAIFGELTVLGAAEGVQRNRQIYDAKATTETELTFITQGSIDEIERCNPDFKRQMRGMALSRAQRFGFVPGGSVTASDADYVGSLSSSQAEAVGNTKAVARIQADMQELTGMLQQLVKEGSSDGGRCKTSLAAGQALPPVTAVARPAATAPSAAAADAAAAAAAAAACGGGRGNGIRSSTPLALSPQAAPRSSTPPPKPKPLKLSLQGGGCHHMEGRNARLLG